jgi:hypothetical protein
MDLARRVLAEVALFLTHPRCSANAREWFLQEFERLRSEAKALLRQQQSQRPPLGELFGRKEVKTTPAAPRPVGRPRKDKAPPVAPIGHDQLKELFKQPSMPAECQRQLEALFERRPTPTTPTATANATPPTIKADDEEHLRKQMLKQLGGLFTKRGN